MSDRTYRVLVMSGVTSTLDIPTEPQNWRAWIVYQLRIRGSSLRKIADREGVVQQAVATAMLMPSYHLEQAIAKELGLKVQDLFPERFDVAGRRIGRIRTPNRISGHQPRNGKGARVA